MYAFTVLLLLLFFFLLLLFDGHVSSLHFAMLLVMYAFIVLVFICIDVRTYSTFASSSSFFFFFLSLLFLLLLDRHILSWYFIMLIVMYVFIVLVLFLNLFLFYCQVDFAVDNVQRRDLVNVYGVKRYITIIIIISIFYT